MFKIAIPAVAALGLIAFAAQSQPTVSDARTGVAPMGWHLSHEGMMAKLAYGVANSDQLALMLTCEPGQSQAAVYGDVRPTRAGQTNASTAAVAIDPLGGGLADEARIALDAPAMQKLARGGKLPVDGEAGRFELKATSRERGLIGAFFAYCGTDRV
jgi:hypothetical protein